MKALGAPDAAELTVAMAGSQKLTVPYPDELAEEAVAKMARLNVGRLPVVERSNPQKFVGYLGRTGIAAAWRLLLNEEEGAGGGMAHGTGPAIQDAGAPGVGPI